MYINELFQQQVKDNPLAKAIVYLDTWINYQTLDKQSSQFARYLQEKYQIIQGDVVAISVSEKSINLLITILAILKLGAAYWPVNKDYKLSVNDSTSQLVKCVVTDSLEENKHNIPINQINTLSQHYCDTPLQAHVSANDLIAYFISTSGTTGNPKTIAISHNNLISTFKSWENVYQLTPHDQHLQMANFSFDVFTGDWVRALCSGGTLVLCPKNHLLNPKSLLSLIERNQITLAEFVPSVLRNLMTFLEKEKKKLSTFRMLICGSDIWYLNECKKLKALCHPKTRLINSYGLSETTIDAAYFEYSTENCPSLKEDSIVPIGKPFPHVTLHVITNKGSQAKVGDQGEIYIGGEGVSTLGYLNNTALTKERFVTLKEKDNLVYKTGDIAEILESGDILFLGRNENQFNINGQRVDFLSVESVLIDHPDVKSAVVIPNTLSEVNFLEAFLVLNQNVHYEQLVTYLKANLPCYAIPRFFYEIESIILNNNNKVIREKSQQKIVRKIDKQSITPTTYAQSEIAKIWQKVLKKNKISINDHFELLGGNSLDYLGIIAEINKLFNANINACEKLETIIDMASKIECDYKHNNYMNT